MKIGIDFGGVLSITDISGAEHRNVSINMPYAKECLEQLVAAGHTLYLISFCGRTRAMETNASIENSGLTHLFAGGQYYVKKKEHKVRLCMKFGIHCMVDDSTDVLATFHEFPMIQTILFDDWLNTMRRLAAVVTWDTGLVAEEMEMADISKMCYLYSA